MHYNGKMDDTTDQMLSGWDEARPDLDVGTLQVTARLSRIGPHLARRQEATSSTGSAWDAARSER